jgi:putative ABC transport system permease protein
MILRHIERQPFKSFLTMMGIAMACGIMMIGGYQRDSIDYMVEVQYGMSQRQDLMATFTDPVANEAIYSLSNIPGVVRAEGFRSVPARLKFEHRFYRTSVNGIEPQGSLVRLLDTNLDVVKLPAEGVVLTGYLAKLLHIKTGDMLTIEVMEGSRPVLRVPVVATTKQFLGVNAYMQREALNRLLKEGNAISGAYIAVDKPQTRNVYKKLRDMPKVAGVVEQASAIQAFYDTLAETVLFFTFISTLLGATISFGVVYNSMRIALSERNRELASMRVLGFTRGEVAYILLGELGLLTLIAIPVGLLFGYGLCGYLSIQFESDLYRIPLVLNPGVYAFAATVVIASSLVSGLMIWRNIAQLDMVAVLKTRE